MTDMINPEILLQAADDIERGDLKVDNIPLKFDMETAGRLVFKGGNSCGAPACLAGHIQARHDPKAFVSFLKGSRYHRDPKGPLVFSEGILFTLLGAEEVGVWDNPDIFYAQSVDDMEIDGMALWGLEYLETIEKKDIVEAIRDMAAHPYEIPNWHTSLERIGVI